MSRLAKKIAVLYMVQAGYTNVEELQGLPTHREGPAQKRKKGPKNKSIHDVQFPDDRSKLPGDDDFNDQNVVDWSSLRTDFNRPHFDPDKMVQ